MFIRASTHRVLSKLGTLPPLVTPSEVSNHAVQTKSYTDLRAHWLNMVTLQQIERLRYQIGLVQRNEAFLLHAGDCAESFEACTHVSPYLIVAPLPHRWLLPLIADC